jgi:tRNA(Ile)-lysidine synthetase-like protein
MNDPVTPEPVSDEEFAVRLDRLGPFDRPLRLAVAVSGGPDSMALSLLAARWVRQRGGQFLALTVDHRLRPDSTAEAAATGAALARHDISHRILTWTDAPARASQDQARRARYDLLGQACREAGIRDLAVAHQREEQAETVLLRLAKGSGIDGLAGMAAWRTAPWGRLLRPLLDLPKARLVATCAGFGAVPVDDPSNRRSRYARARLRAACSTPSPPASAAAPRPASMRWSGWWTRCGTVRCWVAPWDIAACAPPATGCWCSASAVSCRRLWGRPPAHPCSGTAASASKPPPISLRTTGSRPGATPLRGRAAPTICPSMRPRYCRRCGGMATCCGALTWPT